MRRAEKPQIIPSGLHLALADATRNNQNGSCPGGSDSIRVNHPQQKGKSRNRREWMRSGHPLDRRT
jgi:hypothetical protein